MDRAGRQIVLVSAGVVFVLALFFFLLINPRRSELGAARASAAAEQDETQTLQAELDRLEALQRNAPELEAELDRMRRLVPADARVAEFVFLVQDIAEEAGVRFVQVTPGLPQQSAEGAPIAQAQATLSAQGGFFALQDFVRRLHDLERAVRVDSLTMTGVEDERQAAERGRVIMQLVSRIFFDLPEGGAELAPATGVTSPTPTTPSP